MEKTNLREYLKSLNQSKWIYRPNGGNVGDFLITCSEFMLLDSCKIKYEKLSPTNESKLLSKPCNLIMGGGGGFASFYKSNATCVVKKFSNNKNIKKIVVLPNTFYDVDNVVDMFDSRFVVFCRDKNSLSYCLSRNNKAKFLLSDDSAFYFDLQQIDYKKCPKNSQFPRIKQAIDKIEFWLQKQDRKIAPFMREDGEKTDYVLSKDNFDISASFFCRGENMTKAYVNDAAQFLLYYIDKFDTIETNRLHVSVAAYLLKKKIKLHDNCYGKVFSVYDLSMEDKSRIEKVFE